MITAYQLKSGEYKISNGEETVFLARTIWGWELIQKEKPLSYEKYPIPDFFMDAIDFEMGKRSIDNTFHKFLNTLSFDEIVAIVKEYVNPHKVSFKEFWDGSVKVIVDGELYAYISYDEEAHVWRKELIDDSNEIFTVGQNLGNDLREAEASFENEFYDTRLVPLKYNEEKAKDEKE